MTKPILNPVSEKILDAIIKKLPQSLLLTGPNGVGLGAISQYIASIHKVKPLLILPEKDGKIDLKKGTITVEIIRNLYNKTRTKLAGKRIIIIDYTERMTQQAQNAFLKLLEEPSQNIHFILISHSTSKLLPTILSRVEKLEIKPVTAAQTESLLDGLLITDVAKRAQMLFLANGLPAEIFRLQDAEYFAQRCTVMRDGRELLGASAYKKLLLAQKYKDDREQTLQLLLASAKILQQSLSKKPQTEIIKHIDKILFIYDQIAANGNIRLCLSRMAI